jgi:hypothetical protein
VPAERTVERFCCLQLGVRRLQLLLLLPLLALVLLLLVAKQPLLCLLLLLRRVKGLPLLGGI